MTEHPTQRVPSSWARPFFTIWTGQAFSLMGSQLVQFALAWWLTVETGSATVLASAYLVALLPNVFLGPFVGSLVDRWDRRRVMIIADSCIALAVVWLVYLFWADSMQVWHIYVVMLVRGIGGGFHWPAMAASTSLMVPQEHLSRVQGLNQMLQGAMNIAAPPLGALLIELLPLHGVIAIDVGTAVLAILPLFFIAIPQPERGEIVPRITPRSLWGDVRAGLRYIWGWPGLFLVLLMATVINFLLSPAFSLLPILVRQHFGGGVLHLGWLQSAIGVGIVFGGLTLSIWGGFRRRILTTLTGLIGIGVGNLMVGFSPATLFWVAAAGVFVAGLMQPIANGPLLATVQAAVDPRMQGRIFTVISSLASAMTPVGLAIAGPVADRWGVQLWFVLAGFACILMGTAGFFIPVIVRLEETKGPLSAALASHDAKAALSPDE